MDDQHAHTSGAIPVSVAVDSEAAGVLVAERILERLAEHPADDDFYLACPAGRTPSSTYAALGRLASERSADLSRVVLAMVDEYVQAGPDGFVMCDPDSHFSCRRYVATQLQRVNVDLPRSRQISPDHVLCPIPADPAAFDRKVEARGGVDLFLLASGASDGHVAFNPPGTPIDESSRVVELADTTRRDNLATFPGFVSLDDVPTHGVTVGLRLIAQCRETILLVLGSHKNQALRRILGARDFDPAWPATVIHRCARPWIVVDESAWHADDAERNTAN